MTQAWRFSEDGLTPEDFGLVQRYLRFAARRMSTRQVLTLADGLYEMYLSRCEADAPAPEAPRRRWTDHAHAVRNGMAGVQFSDVLSDAMRAAVNDRTRERTEAPPRPPPAPKRGL